MRPRSVLGLVSAYEFGKRRGERRTGERRRHPLLLAVGIVIVLALFGAGSLTFSGTSPSEPAPGVFLPAPGGTPSVTTPTPPAASLVPLPGVPGAFTGGN